MTDKEIAEIIEMGLLSLEINEEEEVPETSWDNFYEQ